MSVVGDKNFLVGRKAKNFENDFPYHLEAIDILHREAGYAAESLKIRRNGLSPSAWKLKNRISFPYNVLKTLTLAQFCEVYGHELGHLKHSETLVSKRRGDLLAKGVALIVTSNLYPLFILPIDKPLPMELIQGVGKWGTLAGFAILAAQNFYVHKDELDQDLFGHNLTGELPSNSLKAIDRAHRGTFAGMVVAIDKIVNQKELLSPIIAGYPRATKRDAYVLKHGNPNPNSRLLELFKLDAARRNNVELGNFST